MFKDSQEQPCCSFCGKTQAQVRKIIVGPNAYICDECVEMCVDIINESCPPSQIFEKESGLPKPLQISKMNMLLGKMMRKKFWLSLFIIIIKKFCSKI